MTTPTTFAPIGSSPATTNRDRDEFDLDIQFLPAGTGVVGAHSEPCTEDNCGGTNESAGVTC